MNTNTLEHITMGIAVAMLGVSCQLHASVAANAGETVRTNVTDNTTLDHAMLGSSATLIKDGYGNLNVNLSKVTGSSSSTILVGNGSMAATLDGSGTERSMTTGLTPPSSVVGKLGLWLDASLYDTKPELFVGTSEGGHAYVSKWLDARETSPASPTLKYAESGLGVTWAPENTEFVRFNGRTPAIWFGGYGSGRTMTVASSGSASALTKITHIFAVHIIDDSFGFIFGNSLHIGGYASKSATLSSSWWIASGGMTETYTGNFYVDGTLTDGQTEHPKKGLQMMEWDFGLRTEMSVGTIFRDGNNHSAKTGYRAGGGYLCEVMCFTSRLTFDERKAVSEHLARKWGLDGNASPCMTVASDTSLTVSSANDTLQTVPFAGPGSVTKTGDGTLNLFSDVTEFGGQLRIASGSVGMVSPIPLEVRGGDRLTVDATGTWPKATIVENDVADDKVVKAGEEDAHVTSLPSSVKQLEVNGGSLHFDAPNTNNFLSAGEYGEVVIANPSFENWGGSEDSWGRSVSSAGVDGWYGSGTAYEIDYTNWTGTVKGLNGAQRSGWYFNKLPPDGKRSLLLNGSAYTYVTIPCDGDYELSFYMSGREHWDYLGGRVDVSLTAADGTTLLYEFGRIMHCWESGYERFTLKAREVKAGKYRLYLKTGGNHTLYDDFKMKRVPSETAVVWRVPNGDFEKISITSWRSIYYIANMKENALDGWSFIQPPDYTGTSTLVGIGSFRLGQANSGKYHLGNLPGDSSCMQLCFCCGNYTNGSAQTTFTPPAGRWYVRADAGRYRTNTASVQVTAKVGDGETKDLGTNTITAHKLTAHYWQKPFIVDGTESVTLSFVFTGSGTDCTVDEPGCMLDNVVLVRVNPDEQLGNGSFEKNESTGGWQYDSTATNVNRWAASYYGESDADRPPESGSVLMSVVNNGIMTRPISFEDDGWRELSWWVRPSKASHAVRQGVRAWIAWTDGDGKACTNVIGSADVTSTNFCRQAFRFRPPAAGNYTFGLEGTRTTGSTEPCAMCTFDCVSIKPAAGVQSAGLSNFSMNEDIKIRVATGARLHLGYEGTNVIGHIYLGGRSKTGVINAKTDPDFITGPGTLLSKKIGFVMLFK